MANLLAGQMALVTGAGRGNGAAIAFGLAKEGARVAVTDLDAATAADTARKIAAGGGKAFAMALDVRDAKACLTAAGEAQRALGGPISILVNNAGVLIREPFGHAKGPETLARTLDVNVHGAARMTHALLPQLKETKGAIVNIASIQSFQALRNSVAYTTSKAALAQMTKALAVELAPDGVRVNAIAPGIIETEMSAATRTDSAKLASFLQRVPMGRCGAPEDLVGPVVFLVSGMSTYVTGAVLAVDGGFLAL